MKNKTIRTRKGKNDWDKLNFAELSQRITSRYSRIEVLKEEVKQLQKLIDDKNKD